MTYTRLGKEREALHGKSEQYKRSATAYFRKRGYDLDKDSLIEGSFDDQVYLTKEGFRINVECKDTEVSLNEADFLVPFGLNLARYAQAAPENKFSYIFCVRSLKNQELAKRMFGDIRDDDEIKNLLQKSISSLKKTKANKSVAERASKILEYIDISVAFSFLDRFEIVEGDYNDLERAALEYQHSRGSSFLRSLGDREKYIKSFERTSKPDIQDETLASNLFRVLKLPTQIFSAKTKFRITKNLLEKIDYEADPFILMEKNLYTFSNLDDKENRLREVINIDSISKEKTEEIFSDHSREYWLTYLLNQCITEYLKDRGLRRRGDRFVFISYDGEEISIPWNPGTRRNRRRFTKCKIRDDGSIAYCTHKAIKPSFKILGGTYFLLLEPCFYFSTDGSEPLNPKKMTQFSSRAWAYHGNDRLLYDLRFWMNYLCLGREILEIPTGGKPINVDTLYELQSVGFGIADDQHSNQTLLSRIQHGIPKVFRATPTKQTELGDFFDFDDGGVMDIEDLEDVDTEWD